MTFAILITQSENRSRLNSLWLLDEADVQAKIGGLHL